SFVMHSSCLFGKCKRHQLAPPPPPPLDPPPKPPNPPPNPPPPPKLPPPQPPPKGPTPLDQPLHGPRPQRLTPRVGPRPMRPRTRIAMKIRMARANGNPLPVSRDDPRGGCTPSSVTLRPSAIRPTMRSTPARSPAPYRPFLNSGTMYCRLVSPAKPSVIHCSSE